MISIFCLKTLEDIRHSQAFLSYSLKCLIETRARLQCYRPKISPRVKMLISVFLHGSSDRVRVISYNTGGIWFFFIQFELNPVQPSLPQGEKNIYVLSYRLSEIVHKLRDTGMRINSPPPHEILLVNIVHELYIIGILKCENL